MRIKRGLRAGLVLAGLAGWTACNAADDRDKDWRTTILKVTEADGKTFYMKASGQRAVGMAKSTPEQRPNTTQRTKDTKYGIVATGLRPCASEMIVKELNALNGTGRPEWKSRASKGTYVLVPNDGNMDIVKLAPGEKTGEAPDMERRLVASCVPLDTAEMIIRELNALSRGPSGGAEDPAAGAERPE